MTEYFRLKDVAKDRLDAERQKAMAKLDELLPEGSFMEVGSTAIPGLIGKQDLDFLVRVPQESFEVTRSKLDTAFQRNPNQLSTEIYQGYTVESEMDVAIQLTIENGPHDTFMEFLELLQTNVDLRERYNDLKREFDGKPMADYRTAKREFIEQNLAQ